MYRDAEKEGKTAVGTSNSAPCRELPNVGFDITISEKPLTGNVSLRPNFPLLTFGLCCFSIHRQILQHRRDSFEEGAQGLEATAIALFAPHLRTHRCAQQDNADLTVRYAASSLPPQSHIRRARDGGRATANPGARD